MKHPGSPKEFFAVDNYPAVYERVEQTWQNPRLARMYHGILSHLVHPRLHFADGAKDRIEQLFDDGGQLAMALTHVSAVDSVAVAAMATQNEVFAPLVGNTMIGARVTLFTNPLTRRFVSDLGAIPIWRRPDVLPNGHGFSEQEVARLKAVRSLAGKAFIQTNIQGMEEGRHTILHVENTRNKVDPLTILPVYGGFGQVVSKVDRSREILIVTGGFYYGDGADKTRFDPTMYLSVASNQDRNEPEAITRTIAADLQKCVNQAIVLHR